jgi:hypothetical protein
MRLEPRTAGKKSAMSSPHDANPIDITRYAEVMAHLRHFPADKHAEVIARMGIRRRDWDAAAARWTRERDAERAGGKLDVTIRYGRVLADTRARLSAVQPSIESLGPYPGPDGLAEDVGVRATSSEGHEPETRSETTDASAEPAVAVPSYLAVERHAMSAPEPLPPSPPAALALPRSMALTALGASTPTAAPLPFAAEPTSGDAPFERAVAHAAEVQGPRAPPREAVSGTVGISNESSGFVPPTGVPDLTLEQYASLRVELDRAPESASVALRRYGVADDARDTLDTHWKARFAADPALRMSFAQKCAEYVAWLEARARG